MRMKREDCHEVKLVYIRLEVLHIMLLKMPAFIFYVLFLLIPLGGAAGQAVKWEGSRVLR